MESQGIPTTDPHYQAHSPGGPVFVRRMSPHGRYLCFSLKIFIISDIFIL